MGVGLWILRLRWVRLDSVGFGQQHPMSRTTADLWPLLSHQLMVVGGGCSLKAPGWRIVIRKLQTVGSGGPPPPPGSTRMDGDVSHSAPTCLHEVTECTSLSPLSAVSRECRRAEAELGNGAFGALWRVGVLRRGLRTPDVAQGGRGGPVSNSAAPPPLPPLTPVLL